MSQEIILANISPLAPSTNETGPTLAYTHIAQELLGEQSEYGTDPSQIAGVLAEYLESGVINSLSRSSSGTMSDLETYDSNPALSFFVQTEEALKDGSLLPYLESVLLARSEAAKEAALQETAYLGIGGRLKGLKEKRAQLKQRMAEVLSLREKTIRAGEVSMSEFKENDEIEISLLTSEQNNIPSSKVSSKISGRIKEIIISEDGPIIVIENASDKRQGPKGFCRNGCDNIEEIRLTGCALPTNYSQSEKLRQSLVQSATPVLHFRNKPYRIQKPIGIVVNREAAELVYGDGLRIDQITIHGVALFPEGKWESPSGRGGRKVRRY